MLFQQTKPENDVDSLEGAYLDEMMRHMLMADYTGGEDFMSLRIPTTATASSCSSFQSVPTTSSVLLDKSWSAGPESYNSFRPLALDNGSLQATFFEPQLSTRLHSLGVGSYMNGNVPSHKQGDNVLFRSNDPSLHSYLLDFSQNDAASHWNTSNGTGIGPNVEETDFLDSYSFQKHPRRSSSMAQQLVHEEVSGISSHPLCFPGPLTGKVFRYVSDEEILKKCKARLDLLTNAYSDPNKVHLSVVKSTEDEFKVYHKYQKMLQNGTAPLASLRLRKRRKPGKDEHVWEPISIFSIFTEVDTGGLEKTDYFLHILHTSCFGKINMRVKGAWTRTPKRLSI